MYKKTGRRGSGLAESQNRRLQYVIVTIIVLALLWVLFAPGAGLVSLFHKKAEQHTLEAEINQLKEQNNRLKEEIQRLNEDPEYLERVARERDFLKKNEQVFDFSTQQKKKKE